MREDDIYQELKGMAQRMLASEPAGITLQPTSLVHEAWVRLGGHEQEAWSHRGHFFSAAAEAMRRVIIDAARQRKALKRGGDWNRVTLHELDGAELTGGDDERLLLMDEALAQLEDEMPDVASVVKLRYFAGLTIEETGRVTGRSPATVKREWTFAATWLRNEISKRAAP